MKKRWYIIRFDLKGDPAIMEWEDSWGPPESLLKVPFAGPYWTEAEAQAVLDRWLGKKED